MSKIGQINYDIQFEPIFTNFTFNGIEIITLTTTSTNTFTLNSAELEIKNCHIIHKGKTIKAKSCLLYTSPSPRDLSTSRMPSSA